MGGISLWSLLLLMTLLVPIYLLPSMIALRKNHPHSRWIVLVNVFAGWLFGIGWLLSLVWSLQRQPTATDPASSQTPAD